MTCVQIQVTCAIAAAADALISSLLEARLIACGQRLGPIASRYRWRGELTAGEEWLVLLKTTARRADDVVACAADASDDEVPEVLVTPVVGGLAGYLEWVEASVSP